MTIGPRRSFHLPMRTLALAMFSLLTLVAAVQAQTLNALHTFSGTPDGQEPIAGVTMDTAGNFYGTTYYGGADNAGLVYKLAQKGAGWVLSPLYSFRDGFNGGYAPVGGVTIGRDGTLYGTASRGGQYGAGTVYKLTPPATFCRSVLCPWTETVLYQFTGGADGGTPDAALIFDNAGNLYGTAGEGGTGNNGLVFELTHSASGWTENVLYSFAGSPDGSGPYSAVTFDGNGNLYGTTLQGGGTDSGTVYQLTPSGSGWTEKVIYAFQGTNDGYLPYAGVVLDPEGNLYGATPYSGAAQGGAIFELIPSNGNWAFSVIYSPILSGLGGAVGTLARSSNGTLYGTLRTGGDFQVCSGYGCGSVFQLTPSSGGWNYTSLYDFTDGGDGGNPEGALILDSAGNLYGTTTGALGGDGSVFEIAP